MILFSPEKSYNTLTGCGLILSQLIAVLLKRIWTTLRSPTLTLVQILIPVVCCVLAYESLQRLRQDYQVLDYIQDTGPPLMFSLGNYTEPIAHVYG